MFASANSSISCLLLLRLSVRFRVGISVVIYTITIHYTLYRHLHNSFPVCHDICINQHNKLLAVTFNCFGENWTCYLVAVKEDLILKQPWNMPQATQYHFANMCPQAGYFITLGCLIKLHLQRISFIALIVGMSPEKCSEMYPKQRISSFAEMYIWLRLHFAMGCKKQGSICEAVRSYCICHCLELPLWN